MHPFVYRFFVVDVGQGLVKGTNDPLTAMDMVQSDLHFVIDAQERVWYGEMDGTRQPVPCEGEDPRYFVLYDDAGPCEVMGYSDKTAVSDFMESDVHYVLDAHTGEWLVDGGARVAETL